MRNKIPEEELNELMEGQEPAESVVVKLNPPIKRGETLIESITLRELKPSHLTGLQIAPLSNGDVDQLTLLLTRVCNPAITKSEINLLTPAQFLALGGKLTNIINDARESDNNLSLREPNTGELRGLQLSNLLQGDVSSVKTLIARISTMKKDEINDLSFEQLVTSSEQIIDFFTDGNDLLTA